MLIKGNAKDWQTRFRLWAALTMASYAIVYNIYYSLGIISINALAVYHNILSKIWTLF